MFQVFQVWEIHCVSGTSRGPLKTIGVGVVHTSGFIVANRAR